MRLRTQYKLRKPTKLFGSFSMVLAVIDGISVKKLTVKMKLYPRKRTSPRNRVSVEARLIKFVDWLLKAGERRRVSV